MKNQKAMVKNCNYWDSCISLAILLLSLVILPSANAQYSPSSTIDFVMELTDSIGTPINTGTCEGRVYDVNMSLLNTLSLSYSSVTGVYYSPFTTPSSEGQYIQVGECNVTINTNQITVYARKPLIITGFTNLDEKFESINNTIKSVNGTIMTKLYGIQDEITSVNDSVKSVNGSVNYWGSSLDNDVNYWGNTIYNYLLNMTTGNVTALVDYDEIAITVMQYFRGVKLWEWWGFGV
jgi:hypothetical protein